MTTYRWRILLWTFMLGAVIVVMWQSRLTLLPFIIGGVITYAVTPVIDRMASVIPARTHRADVWRRGLVILLIYIAFFSALGGALFVLIPIAVEQFTEFIDRLPELVEAARVRGNQWFSDVRAQLPMELRERVDEFSATAGERAAEAATGAFGRVAAMLTGTIGFIFGILVLPFWMFYTLRDRHFVERNFLRAVPAGMQDDVRNIARIADRLLGRYIRGQLLLGLIVGTAVGVGLTLMNVEMSIGLGLWAGITELIPIVGPWLGAIPALMIVAATNPDLFIWVALLYLVVQQLENNLLVPRVQGQMVDIHPAMVILLLVVAGSIWGIVGMLVVIPLTAILREFFWYADRRLRGESPNEAYGHSHVGSRRRDMALDARVDAVPPEQQPPAEPIVGEDGSQQDISAAARPPGRG